MAVKLYPPEPVQRLMNPPIPSLNVAAQHNPILQKLPQILGYGWGGCTPQHQNFKARLGFGHMGNMQLIEHIGHAKKFVEEHVQAYIDGKLPTMIRKFKYAADVLKVLRFMVRAVATLNYIEQLVRQEIAMANQWANENLIQINYALNQITPAGLRTAAEEQLAKTLNRALIDIQQQINQNGATIACLI